MVGRGLDPDVEGDRWCRQHGVGSGADYLLLWLGSMALHPADPTAYLFIHSKLQNTGKSMFVDSIRRHLLAGGVVPGDKALANEGGFNSELFGAVLVSVEETNVAKLRRTAHDRLKAWVTGEEIALTPKGKPTFSSPNFTHWVQTANDASYCPIFAGDTRITVWEAQPPEQDERAGKDVLHGRLAGEAAAFLYTLLSVSVPSMEAGDGRLRIPPVSTLSKEQQARASRTDLEVWLDDTPGWIYMSDEELVRRVRSAGVRYANRDVVLRKLPPADDSYRRFLDSLRGLEDFVGSPSEIADRVGISAVRAGPLLKRIYADEAVGWVTRRRRHGGRREIEISWCHQAPPLSP